MRFLKILLCMSSCYGFVSVAAAQSLTGYENTASKKDHSPFLTSYNTLQIEDVSIVQDAQEREAAQEVQEQQVQSSPIDFEADNVAYDETGQILRASGNVFLTQNGRILRADRITYDLSKDIARAEGNVVLNEPTGAIHTAEFIVLQGGMKRGLASELISYLEDGSTFTSRQGIKQTEEKTVMKQATYTACEPCVHDPDAPPLWQLKAQEVIHNEEDASIAYKNAWFELYGFPVAYLPYFKHPDGTVDQKSGFLPPLVGFNSDLGAFFGAQYYYALSPDKDLTAGLIGMTQRNPLLYSEYRQRWQDASLTLNGGITYAEERVRGDNDIIETKDDDLRGHITAEGLWNMNETWRSGLDIEWVSDDQYIRRYDFDEFGLDDKDVLESKVYAERFEGRNYFAGRMIRFQDVRVREEQEEQPEVLPEIIASYKGTPGNIPLIKGQWSLDASFLGLQRGDDAQDVNRASLEGGWNRQLVSDYGFVTDITFSARGDLYNTRERDVARLPATGQNSTTTETRFFPLAHGVLRYPLARRFETSQMTVEPIVALTVSPNLDINNDIPNEDSQDVQIDASNLFEPNRFPGLDRIEDQSRVTYGIRTGLYEDDGGDVSVFLGQSYRLEDDNNPFPEGSGLNKQESDVVGEAAVTQDNFSANYRFQYDSRNLNAQRHEVNANAKVLNLTLSSQYLFAKELGGTDIDESREQINIGAAYDISPSWRIRAAAKQDLGAQPGLREAALGLDYFGQCISVSLTAERNLVDEFSGESDTEILMRIGFKNLGEFQASGLRVDSNND